MQTSQDVIAQDKESAQDFVVPVSNTTEEKTGNKSASTVNTEEEGPHRLVTSTPEFIESLFADGNECITAPNGIFPVKDETRLILALFSNGRFLVAEPYLHDGRVLSFQVLARKRNLQIGQPEPVSKSSDFKLYRQLTRFS